MSSSGERVVAGRYRLRRRLGQGAMGTVWEAFDEFLRRPVAVKEVLLPPGMPDDQAAELRERTLREARAIAALSHPNVVTVHDMAREDGEPFVVMEYMSAHSLATVIDVLGPLPEAKAAAIADAVAAGLAAAHHMGITHRDVKPGNVLIGVDGRVKLTDFGIARNVAERTLTSTGIMLGSPAYIAPEVAAGREVTPAADLWGFGATMFAVIEGRPPYDVSGAVLATVNQVVNGEVPRPSKDGPLTDIVAALMVKEPSERISLQEVRNRLHSLLPPPSTPLMSEEELGAVNAVVLAATQRDTEADEEPNGDLTDTGEKADEEVPAAPLAADPGPLPSQSAPLAASPGALPAALAGALKPTGPSGLAPAPGPLPFDVSTTTQVQASRSRGSLATGVVAFLAVLFFFGAAGGGFALSRYVGGESLLPPEQSDVRTSTPPADDKPEELTTRSGNAATVTGTQGGGFSLPVPRSWVEFVEEVSDEDFVNSTRVYYVSPDGTQLLTVERLVDFFPDHTVEDYIDRVGTTKPGVFNDMINIQDINGLDTNGVEAPAQAVEMFYRVTINAKELAPDIPGTQDMNRVTYANVLPYFGDLWVVSMTVPVDQEDSGGVLFRSVAKGFQVTG